ncbi:MAG: S9 family peptidase, partial [Duncaniella sp.]|nr:S9 family peptidase [Duncaniella sp.]
DDKTVSPHNSLAYFAALVDSGVPSTLHVYPNGGHGWGSRDTGFRQLWEAELTEWIKSL